MFSVKKNWQLQLQVSNICHINNMFRTRSLSLMYCVNLAETSHTHQSTVNACLNNLIISMVTNQNRLTPIFRKKFYLINSKVIPFYTMC